MIRIRDISMPPEHDANQLIYEASRLLRISASKIRELSLVRRSVDARKKPNVYIIYTVDVAVEGNENKILRNSGCKKAAIAPCVYYKPPKAEYHADKRPVVVGFGPAGMFAGLILAMAGLKPIILERGEDALKRHEKVQKFFATGELDPESNVQFGEGGAGTFSDGKLNTGVNNPRIGWILEQFVKAGAREDILYDAKPHVGTDVLLTVVQNLRKRILSLGGEVRFSTKVTGILEEQGTIIGLQTNQGAISCDHVILAIGHSARDTFRMLHEMKIPMEAKPFAMGVRIEQLQSVINRAQYGAEDLPLPPADYKLVRHLGEETVYTFCMCPGGHVVAATSENGKIVTNGMSNADRDGVNANAALLVSLNPSDFPYEGVLGGMLWQEELEKKAFEHTGCYHAPAQTVGDFLQGKASTGSKGVEPSYKPAVVWTDLHEVLPTKITRALKEALPQMEQNLKGFAAPEAVLTAPETRSSSPVRILRGEDRQSRLRGLYPAGEGAGYAGGIMSAAIDGIMAAEALLENLK